MVLLPFTFVLLTLYSTAEAGSANHNDPCDTKNNRLQTGTYQFYSDCNSVTFCDPVSKTCQLKKCTKDDFPFGFTLDNIPDKCHRGTFCPDEMDECQPWVPVGGDCQKNRDDQCEGPPNFKELADTTNRGLNFNGSVCLNTKCFWANVTEGNDCELDNTAYIGYATGGEFNDIVSRGNCRVGLYCDAQNKKCAANKALGATCGADKECDSWNCLSSGVCGVGADQPRHFPMWVYVVVGLAIIGGMFGTLFGLYLFHKKHRDIEREKRMQYWREQNAFHQNLLQMRDTARASIHSLASASHDGAYTDEAPLTQHAARQGSGLRYTADDSSDDGSIYQHSQQKPLDNRF